MSSKKRISGFRNFSGIKPSASCRVKKKEYKRKKNKYNQRKFKKKY